MLGFKEFAIESKEDFEKFENYITEAEENEEEENTVFNAASYYIYFVIYPSPKAGPTQVGTPSRECLYVGIKHKNKGPTMSASNFWAGLRWNASKNRHELTKQSLWDKSALRVDDTGQMVFPGETGMYMTSAGANQNPESLCKAFIRGVYQNDLAFHPLIMNRTSKGFINNAISKITKKGFDKSLEEKFFDFLKELKAKKVQPRIEQEEDEEPTQKETNESVLLERTTPGYRFPLDDNGKPYDHKTLINSGRYGYKIFVCDDMTYYQHVLNELSEAADSPNSKLPAGVRDLLKDKAANEVEYKEQRLDIIRDCVIARFYQAIYDFFVQNYSTFNFVPEEIKTVEKYEKFILETTKKNPVLTIGTAEYTLSRELHEIGEKQQGKATENCFKDGTIIANFYIPPMDKKIKDKLMEYLKVADLSEKDLPKIYTAQKAAGLLSDKQLNYSKNRLDNSKQAKSSFSPLATLERTHGIGTSEDTVYPLLYNNSGVNYIKKFVEQGEYKKEIKEIVEKLEFPLRYLKASTKNTSKFYLTFKKEGKDYIVAMKNNRLIELPLKPIENDLFDAANMVSMETERDMVNKHNLFTLYHLLAKLGYKVNGSDSLKKWAQKNDLEERTKVLDNIIKTFQAEKKAKEEQRRLEREKREQEELEDSFIHKTWGNILNEWTGYEEVIEEGWKQALAGGMALVATLVGSPAAGGKSIDKEQTKASQSAPKKAKQVKPKSQYDQYATALAIALLKEEKVFDVITLEKNGREKTIPLRMLQKELLHLGGIRTTTTKSPQSIEKKPAVESKPDTKKSLGEGFQKKGMKSFSEFITEDEQEAKEVFSNIRSIIDECDDYKLKQMYVLLLKLLETDAPITDSGSATKNQKHIEKVSQAIVDYTESKNKNTRMKKNLRVLSFAKNMKPINKKDFKIKRPTLN